MSANDFNGNGLVDKKEWQEFEAMLKARGYEQKWFTDTTKGYRIWPTKPAAKHRWGEGLSHLWIYGIDQGDRKLLTWGQATVRLESVYSNTPDVKYDHTNLTGPHKKKKDSPLHNSIDRAILNRICQSYIADPGYSEYYETAYQDMLTNGYPQYMQDWTALLDTVQVLLNEMYWSDPPTWSLRAQYESDWPKEN
ncbi:Hypothetical protein D9617_6g094120 [Elsinoe fawcettii]|nr:Hypothetical protein D9617_6g094120 [Elsinoe fawcettii]